MLNEVEELNFDSPIVETNNDGIETLDGLNEPDVLAPVDNVVNITDDESDKPLVLTDEQKRILLADTDSEDDVMLVFDDDDLDDTEDLTDVIEQTQEVAVGQDE